MRDLDALVTHPLTRLFGLPVWWIHQGVIHSRNRRFDRGHRQVVRLPVPVVAVGNITLGGTGKTPLVHWLADRLAAQGYRPAIISRGYRSAPDGRNDEARLSDHPTCCHPRRVLAGRSAIARGAEVLIADDLFQHRQLHRDLDLVCLDATRPFGLPWPDRGRILPLGLLRETAPSLRRADVLILTRCDQVPAAQRAQLDAHLARFGKTLVHARHRPLALVDLVDDSQHPPDWLAERAVWLACGLGNPQAFAHSCRDLGARIAGTRFFADHHPYTREDLRLLHHRRDGHPLIMTSKDAVKLRPLLSQESPGSLFELRIGCDIDPADQPALQAHLVAALKRGARGRQPTDQEEHS